MPDDLLPIQENAPELIACGECDLLVRPAEVLGGVAAELGLEPDDVADRVSAVAVPEVSAIDVTEEAMTRVDAVLPVDTPVAPANP